MSGSVRAGRRVLLVEDEYFLAEELNGALTDAGAQVLGPVPSVRAALDLLARGAAPEVAMLDVSLSGEMVYPVADALLSRGVPFLFATGYDQAALPERYAAVRRLEKPIDASAALREVARLFGGA